MTKKEQVSAFNFEASLAELEALVQQMEQGDLTRGCQTALAQAEQKVNVLMQDAQGKVVEQPFSKES